VVGDDCFVPLGDAWSHVLPGVEDVIEAVQRVVAKPAAAT
jgi:hypothetical protein